MRYFRFGPVQHGSAGGGGFLTGVIVPDPVAFWFGLPQQGSIGFAPPVEPPPPDFACASNAPSATIRDMQAAIVSSLFMRTSQLAFGILDLPHRNRRARDGRKIANKPRCRRCEGTGAGFDHT